MKIESAVSNYTQQTTVSKPTTQTAAAPQQALQEDVVSLSSSAQLNNNGVGRIPPESATIENNGVGRIPPE